MSLWITLILALVQNLPAIIKVIQEIIALMKGAPKADHDAMKIELKEALRVAAANNGSVRPVEELLERIRTRLKEKAQAQEPVK